MTAAAAAGPSARLRLHVHEPSGAAWVPGLEIDLPEAAARHVQVRRLQPGDGVVLFDGFVGFDDRGGPGGLDGGGPGALGGTAGPVVEWPACVLEMGRRSVRVRLGAAPVDASMRELPVAVTLAFGMPANERMDALVEKATELGAARLVPLVTERSVLRLEGERAERRRVHWQGVAVAATEQCGRARCPEVAAVTALGAWLSRAASVAPAVRWVLSTAADAGPWPGACSPATAWEAAPAPSAATSLTLLSGPEGGLSEAEEAAARAAGFAPVSLGPRILRADTAPLAALAALAALGAPAMPGRHASPLPKS